MIFHGFFNRIMCGSSSIEMACACVCSLTPKQAHYYHSFIWVIFQLQVAKIWQIPRNSHNPDMELLHLGNLATRHPDSRATRHRDNQATHHRDNQVTHHPVSLDIHPRDSPAHHQVSAIYQCGVTIVE